MNQNQEPIALSPIRQSRSCGKLYEALAKAQGEFKEIVKDKIADAGTYKYGYADLAAVLAAVRPALSANGLCIMQQTLTRDQRLVLNTRLAHASDQWIECDYPVIAIGGERMTHQVIGSALTYARRYTLSALVGVAAEEDTDGKGADTGETPQQRQAAQPPRRSPPKQEEPPVTSRDPLITEMLNQSTVESLRLWHEQNEGRLRAKPQAWQNDTFYPRYEARMEELKA